jgi:CRISPR-associated protein Cmr2
MTNKSFVLFTLGPVQRFIEAARTVRDLWSGSFLLSYLTFRAMEHVAGAAGPGAIVFPSYADLPLARWKPGTKAEDAVLEPCIPNRFLAEVDGGETAARKIAEAAEEACRGAWKQIADDVKAFLGGKGPGKNLDPYDLWDLQVGQFFEAYTAVLPQDEYGTDRVTALLGKASGELWADRHQVAQRMLAAAKNRRHFPVYAPKIPAGEVPQKDTLLGTLEHLGPGKLGEVGDFWATAAVGWHSHGSKVTRNERLCAVSLVKRFAWAHHFATKEMFKRDVRDLKFQDSATVAAAKWLRTGEELSPNRVARDHDDWSGQWLHWPTREPPKGDEDERKVPQPVWDVIGRKKRKEAEGKPPTYYAVFVFDGDRMGDRFNAATSAGAYRAVSAALATFALKVIDPIVTRHFGELIYAGGDDAICVLPTETALACVGEINAAFAANWERGLPGDEPATISGGLVVAHYKEDLRFVLEQARDAEKKAKAAGRNALQVTVCRRSGEHSTALVPWGFVRTVAGWVDGFLEKGASDRWAYKLRGDLPVIGEDRDMFRLELGRQLGRAEDGTRVRFPAAGLRAQFGDYLGRFLDPDRQAWRLRQRKKAATDGEAITDFVTLLQTASFLARGRDA